MPRRSSNPKTTPQKPKTTTTTTPTTPSEPKVAAKPHNGLTKPEPKDPTKSDERLVGFQFPNNPGTTPFDWAVDGTTGLVKKMYGTHQTQGQPLWGVKCQSIVEGIRDATLPPLSIWKSGRWLNDIDSDDAPIYDVKVENWRDVENNIWLVSGEGSPGCYAFYAFFVPNSESDAHTPRHPMLWGQAFKEKKSDRFDCKTHKEFNGTPKDPRKSWLKTWEILEYGFLFDSLEKTQQELVKKDEKPWSMDRWDGWSEGRETSPLVKSPPPTKTTLPGPKQPQTYTATMPVGVKFRCPGCGHWYKELDFATHSKHSLCPVLDDGVADWTILCDDKCGCEMIEDFPTPGHTLGEKTLDHVCAPKPGFPRPKKEVKSVTETTETPEPTPEGEPEPTTEGGEGGEEGGTTEGE